MWVLLLIAIGWLSTQVYLSRTYDQQREADRWVWVVPAAVLAIIIAFYL